MPNTRDTENYTGRLIVLEQKFDSMAESLDFIRMALIGEINDKPGLIIRLDRVEQKLAFRDKIGWLLISAVTTTALAQVWTFIH